MTPIRKTHDKFIRDLMSRKQAVEAFLRNYLDKEVVALIDLSTLEIKKDTFIDQELGEHFSDILYQVKLLSGREIKIYILIEHKSYSDDFVSFQLLRYMIRIWELELKQLEGEKKKEKEKEKEKEVGDDKKKQEKFYLTPILPIVFYHGAQEWQVPQNFHALFLELPSLLAPYVPDYRYFLYDLTKVNDSSIQGDVILRIGLLSLKYALRDDLPEKLDEIFALFEQLTDEKMAREYLSTLVRYLSSKSAKITTQQLKSALDKKFSEEGESIMATIAETLIEQGREEMRLKMEQELLQAHQRMEQQVQEVRQQAQEAHQRMEEKAQEAHQQVQQVRQEAQQAHQEVQQVRQEIVQEVLTSIKFGLDLKFGEEGLRLFNEVQQIQETSLLKAIRAALKFVSDLGELRSIYQPALASHSS